VLPLGQRDFPSPYKKLSGDRIGVFRILLFQIETSLILASLEAPSRLNSCPDLPCRKPFGQLHEAAPFERPSQPTLSVPR